MTLLAYTALHYGQIHYIRVYEKSNFISLIIGKGSSIKDVGNVKGGRGL